MPKSSGPKSKNGKSKKSKSGKGSPGPSTSGLGNGKSPSDSGPPSPAGKLLAEVTKVKHEVMGAWDHGALRFYEAGIVFVRENDLPREEGASKSSHDWPIITAADDVESLTWSKLLGGERVLRVTAKDGTSHRFVSGNKDLTRVGKALKPAYKAPLLEKQMSIDGSNWGTASFRGSSMQFNVGSLNAFEIPLNQVSNCSTGKNEAVMEFHQGETSSFGLMEMRFHIPGTEGNDADEAVAAFKQQVMNQANVVSASGDTLAIFKEVSFMTPRGRYELKIYQNFLHMHGKTFDHKIPKETFLRLFQLPHVDQRKMFIVMNLEPPVKQGQTLYPFLVCSMDKDEEMTLEIPLSEEELKEKFGSEIKKRTTGPTYEILSKLLQALVGRPILTTGAFYGRPYASGGSTGTENGGVALSCSHKATAGYLYPLKDCFVFIHKPAVLVRHGDVDEIHFARSGANTRFFDLEIHLSSGGGSTVTFNSISKDEKRPLLTYLRKFNLNVKRDPGDVDEMFEAGWEETGETNKDLDVYLNRVLAEAGVRGSASIPDHDGEDEDDEDEDDADYDPAKDPQAMEIALFRDDASTSISTSSDDERMGEEKQSLKESSGKSEKSFESKGSDGGGIQKKMNKKQGKEDKKKEEEKKVRKNKHKNKGKKEEEKEKEEKEEETEKEEKEGKKKKVKKDKKDKQKKEKKDKEGKHKKEKKEKESKQKKEKDEKKEKLGKEEKDKDNQALSSKSPDKEVEYKSKEYISAPETSSEDRKRRNHD